MKLKENYVHLIHGPQNATKELGDVYVHVQAKVPFYRFHAMNVQIYEKEARNIFKGHFYKQIQKYVFR
jgi:hypothetical protein